MEDYYEILGVDKNASKEEIKEVFHKLSHIYHPDKGGNEWKFKKISVAYGALSDDEKRSAYDSFLKNRTNDMNESVQEKPKENKKDTKNHSNLRFSKLSLLGVCLAILILVVWAITSFQEPPTVIESEQREINPNQESSTLIKDNSTNLPSIQPKKDPSHLNVVSNNNQLSNNQDKSSDELFFASMKQDVTKVKEILNNQNNTKESINNALIGASSMPDFEFSTNAIDTIKLLIKAGADVNAKSKLGDTALMGACSKKNLVLSTGVIDIIKLLIKAGADVNAVDAIGQSALSKASFNGESDIIKILIDSGADVNIRDYMNDTPLTLAACYGNSDQTGEAIINLINAGADVRVKNIKEKTALGCAVSNKHVPLNVIEVLEGHIKE